MYVYIYIYTHTHTYTQGVQYSCTYPVDVELVLAFDGVVHLAQQRSEARVVGSDDTGVAGVALDRRLAGLYCNRTGDG
jgi:hypothetical protein